MNHQNAFACWIAALSLAGCARDVTPRATTDDRETMLQDGSPSDAGSPDATADTVRLDDANQGNPEAPRLRSPLSTATATSQQPTLNWILGAATDGARVELCRDRAMMVACVDFDATGSSSRPPAPLASGMWFWRARGRRGTTVGQDATPVWEFRVGARSATVDTSWGTVLDVNGDGYADILVGAAGAMNDAGRMYLYLGGVAGLATSPAISLANPQDDDHYFGRSFASVGDINGDGYADVGAATPNTTSMQDRVYVYAGGPAGLATTPAWVIDLPENTQPSTGVMITSAGDLNGDGYADLAIGEYETDDRAGRAYIYLGGSAGFASMPDATLSGADGPNAGFGHTIENAGDIDGDGFSEIAIGAPTAMNGFGRIYIFHGSPAGVVSMPATVLTGPDGNGTFSYPANNASDVNGDGYADLMVGAPTLLNSIGRAYEYLGSPGGVASPAEVSMSDPNAASEYFGGEMSTGDLNGDGFADLVVTAYAADNHTGRAFVYVGGSSGCGQMPSNSFVGPDGANGQYGDAIMMPGDVNGDGFDDIAIAAGYALNATGRVYVYFGSPMGLPPVATVTLTGLDGPNGYFGSLGR